MPSPAKWVWCDLMTTDLAAATSFYARLLGWTMQDAEVPDRTYLIISSAGTRLGGMIQLPPREGGGPPPSWLGYIAVDDVDAYAARITARGGKLHHVPEDIPGVGRFAVVADPQGAVFTLFVSAGGVTPWPAAADRVAGHVGWVELHARDWSTAFAFYEEMFGWTRADAVDMGPMGIYQMYATGGDPVGGMMNRAAGPPAWLYYFNVTDIKAATATVQESGGRVVHLPHQVPGGSWVALCADPQGALFAVVSPPG